MVSPAPAKPHLSVYHMVDSGRSICNTSYLKRIILHVCAAAAERQWASDWFDLRQEWGVEKAGQTRVPLHRWSFFDLGGGIPMRWRLEHTTDLSEPNSTFRPAQTASLVLPYFLSQTDPFSSYLFNHQCIQHQLIARSNHSNVLSLAFLP